LQNFSIFDTGSTSTAMWVKLPNGLLIQWSTASVWGTFTYPKPFKNTNYVLIAAYGNNSINWVPNASSPTMFKVSATQGNIYSNERVRGYWLAIGY
ncbi:gp53-like domain-containing protein, partial [Fusobacterium varium]